MKSKSLLFVTDRELLKASSAEKPAEFNDPEFDSFLAAVEADRESGKTPRSSFAQPDSTPIEIPQEYASDQFKADMFRLAMHECGHSLAGLLLGGGCNSVTLTGISGGGEGHSWSSCGADGQPSARVRLAGLAAERLVAGEPLLVYGFDSDIQNAKDDLRDAGIFEADLDDELQHVYGDVQAMFTESWLPALRALATALVKRGFLSNDAITSIISDAQGRMQKSFPQAVISECEKLTDKVLFKSARIEQKAALQTVNKLNEQLSRPGLSVSEASRLECLRNHADMQARGQA